MLINYSGWCSGWGSHSKYENEWWWWLITHTGVVDVWLDEGQTENKSGLVKSYICEFL